MLGRGGRVDRWWRGGGGVSLSGGGAGRWGVGRWVGR